MPPARRASCILTRPGRYLTTIAGRGASFNPQSPDSGRTMLIASEYFCQELIDAARPRELSTHQSAVAVAALDHPLSIWLGDGNEAVTLPAYASCWFRPRPAPTPWGQCTGTELRPVPWWRTCRHPARTPRISYGPLGAIMISCRSWPSSRQPRTWDSRRPGPA
jgi:hypothetical protein